jgi:hypothetical protein
MNVKGPAQRQPQLLYARSETARLLGTSVATVIRLEKQGLLTPVRLTRAKTGAVHHRAEQVHALASASNE